MWVSVGVRVNVCESVCESVYVLWISYTCHDALVKGKSEDNFGVQYLLTLLYKIQKVSQALQFT